MANPRAFISFDFDHNEIEKNLFGLDTFEISGQKKNVCVLKITTLSSFDKVFLVGKKLFFK